MAQKLPLNVTFKQFGKTEQLKKSIVNVVAPTMQLDRYLNPYMQIKYSTTFTTKKPLIKATFTMTPLEASFSSRPHFNKATL